ncbi:MAG: imelysin family protein [Flavobacteriales bacterium]|nr:imelysin family protein [Flavobacteriales bacterium]
MTTRYNKFNILYPILLIVVFGFSCCEKRRNSTPSETTDPYDNEAMLSNLATNYIVPAYSAYETETNQLKTDVASFNATPSTVGLQSVRTQWETALLTWQDVAFLEIGPASTIALRGQTNIYPVDTSEINDNIASGDYNLETVSNYTAKGFQAVDYLINGKGSTDQDIVDYYSETPNAKVYLQDVVDELASNATSVSSSWNSDYATSFIDNSASNAQGSSVSDLINSLVKHYETYVRKGKIGLPAGVFNGFSGQEMPTHVEALYYNQSLPFVHRSLTAIQKFIKGESYNDAVNGDGLDDYMAFVEAMSGTLPLEEVIDAQIENIILELNSISDPLSKEVVDNNSGVQAVYQEMQKLVPYLKVDMTNALDVLITYQDSDGD